MADDSPSWRTHNVDLEGPWGWRDVPAELIFTEIVPKLHEYESMRWADFAGTRNHDVDTADLCDDARRRLAEVRPDLDSLFSIRLTGTKRVWAERSLTRLNVLWWDPKHEVCPSRKRHT
jgi:hypothetical protein